MKTLEQLRASILDAMNAAAPNAEDEQQAVNKSAETDADQVLATAVQNYLNAGAYEPAVPATQKSGKRLKEKGIAITHMELQGGAANKRNTPLLMKANGVSLNVNNAALDNAAPEILAALAKLGYVLGGNEWK